MNNEQLAAIRERANLYAASTDLAGDIPQAQHIANANAMAHECAGDAQALLTLVDAMREALILEGCHGLYIGDEWVDLETAAQIAHDDAESEGDE